MKPVTWNLIANYIGKSWAMLVTLIATPLLINLQPGVQYYWRVGYEATPGSYVWSLSESFVTGDMGDLPRAPMLVLPESSTTVYSLKPHLTWEHMNVVN